MTRLSHLTSRLKHPRRTLFLTFFLTAVLLYTIPAATAALDPYDCRILPNVTIGGLDVGGMTRREARQVLQGSAEQTLLSQELPVELPEETISLIPADIGMKLNVRRAVKAAYRIGREEETVPDDASYSIGLLAFLSCDTDFIQTRLEEYALRYDTVLSEAHWELSGTMPELGTAQYDPSAPCQALHLTLGTPEAHLDTAKVLDRILTVYDQAIAAAEQQEYRVSVEIIPDTLPKEPDLTAIYAEFAVPPVDDSLDMETYEVISGAFGYHFDLSAAKQAVANADFGGTISIPMKYIEPEILGDEVYFQDVLGSCETRHTDNENRNTNLRLVCKFLDGLILQPGEEFSYNGAVGERSAERGFKSAGSYSIRGVENTIGGGVCQGSTTLYNCALLADLEILERVCHGYTVGYVPIGLDAAVNWLTNTDLRFRNSTHFPIQIRAELSDGYMKMQLLGTDEKDYYIKMESTRGDGEQRIYSRSYKCKYDKKTHALISRDIEAHSSYMYFSE